MDVEITYNEYNIKRLRLFKELGGYKWYRKKFYASKSELIKYSNYLDMIIWIKNKINLNYRNKFINAKYIERIDPIIERICHNVYGEREQVEPYFHVKVNRGNVTRY
jgi:hypothetical protein